jgi:hypothetical protein
LTALTMGIYFVLMYRVISKTPAKHIQGERYYSRRKVLRRIRKIIKPLVGGIYA